MPLSLRKQRAFEVVACSQTASNFSAHQRTVNEHVIDQGSRLSSRGGIKKELIEVEPTVDDIVFDRGAVLLNNHAFAGCVQCHDQLLTETG